MKNKSYIMWGVILIGAGVLLVLNALGVLQIGGRMLPAIVMLGVGVCFHLGFALSGGKKPGLLVPGGILLVYGGVYLACAIGSFWLLARLWPLFILGVALGLFEMYVFSRGRAGSMIPVFILTTVGGAFLLSTLTDLSGFIVVGAALVILGAVLFVAAFRRGKEKPAGQPAQDAIPPQEAEEKNESAAQSEYVQAEAEPVAQPFAGAPEVVVQAQAADEAERE